MPGGSTNGLHMEICECIKAGECCLLRANRCTSMTEKEVEIGPAWGTTHHILLQLFAAYLDGLRT
jgi:hypothetical protein